MKEKNQFWKGKGFYAALTLVVMGAAFASFLAINSMMSKLGTAQQNPVKPQLQEERPWSVNDTPVENKKQDVPVKPAKPSDKQKPSSTQSNTASSRQPASAAPSASTEPSAPPAPPKPQYVVPITGSVSQNFSGDELIYQTTLKDWRTHNGTDFDAQISTAVRVPADGTITLVQANDPKWGSVVEITTQDGTIVRLSGVDKVKYQQGTQVKQGETLGVLGEIPSEVAQPPHLHVEVLQNGKYIDPLSILK